LLENSSVVSRLLTQAQRRSFVQLALDQAALALAIGMGGAIVLLLTGTQILEWYWVVLLAVASLGIGLYRLRKSIPSKYKLAQWIDRRLRLADALSTATYFASHDARRSETDSNEAVRLRQREEAERVARTVDVRAALPGAKSRFLYPALALFAVACGLFVVRYAVTGKLSLEPSLVKIAFDTFFPSKQLTAQNLKKGDPMKSPPVDQDGPDAPSTQSDQTPDSQLDSNEPPDASNPQASDNSKDAAKDGAQTDPDQAAGDQGEKGDKTSQGNDSDQNNDSKDSSKSGGDQKNGKQDSKQQNASNENSSLMDKIKDAMSNMMNKMKPSSAQNGQNSQNSQKDGQTGQQQKSGQKGDAQQKQAQQSSADAQSDQSDSGDKKQSADAKGAEKSSDKNASQDSKSGIGSADGDKAAREAEQAQAMGKISEILGKRAQNVTGEVMVEVGQSKQQLKTPWAQKSTTHTDAGGEINRDEVPLIYQQYVEQYFEQIRKGADAPKSKKAVNEHP
jgi:hypothetical protein